MLDKRFHVDLNATVAFKPELLFGECEFKLRNIFTVLSSYMTALIRRLFLTLYQSELAWYEGGIMTDLLKAFYNQV
ncbi:uncharacterized protein OCT59_009914 [Rhizophagus irregularis]|uniref:uncharacterized protein n=1 Tax=Rhizophagus irregularis TaxID=588596 RepID=UPI00331C0A9E|nr:hypothetical protein OCT59_009914 [Rhizophagus irregularis]